MACRIRVLFTLLLATTAIVSAQPTERYTFALTGDSIITRAISVYEEPEFLEMIELIRSADVAFTNVEMLFHDYEFYPMASSGGTYMRAQPELAKELAWAGFHDHPATGQIVQHADLLGDPNGIMMLQQLP